MIEIKKKSVIPIYGTGAIWVLFCLFLPFQGISSFIVLACVGVFSYLILAMAFPGTIERIESTDLQKNSGDEKIDALVAEGEKSVAEMRSLSDTIPDENVKYKAESLVDITDKIFKKLLIEPNVYTQVKRFSDFFLPTSVKLLRTYSNFGQSGATGENISSTMERIDAALDTSLESYKKFYDSLFETQALDIETDITVFDTMLKKEGLLDSDFQAKADNSTEEVPQPVLTLESDTEDVPKPVLALENNTEDVPKPVLTIENNTDAASQS